VPLAAAGMRQLQQYGGGYRGTYNQVNNPQSTPTTTLNGGASTGGTTGSGGNVNTLNGSGGGGNSTANASNNGGDGELLPASMHNNSQSMPNTNMNYTDSTDGTSDSGDSVSTLVMVLEAFEPLPMLLTIREMVCHCMHTCSILAVPAHCMAVPRQQELQEQHD
jgi:hypothetical protein